MMKTDHNCKYYKLQINENEYLIILSKNKSGIVAKTNESFYDKNEESFVNAVGVGETEDVALKMCVWEIKQYITGKSGMDSVKNKDYLNTDISTLRETTII